jgi:hypothetical protein
MSKKNETKPLKQPDVIGSASFLHTILTKLEVDYGWSFYDENKKIVLTDMQRELIQDVAKATKELFS